VLPVLELDGSTTAKLVRRLRRVTRKLGPVRERDVLLALVDELRASGQYSGRALDAVYAHVRRVQESSRRSSDTGKISDQLARLGKKLKNVTREVSSADRSGKRSNWLWAVDARVTRRASTLKSAMAEAGAVYWPERLHAARVAVKKLRYAVEVGAEARGVRNTPDVTLLKRTQDLLGRLHDLQLFAERVRQTQATLVPPDPALEQELGELQLGVENACRRVHARYSRIRPQVEALCARLHERVPAAGATGAVRRAG
jgi:CHAD domain-containing protein